MANGVNDSADAIVPVPPELLAVLRKMGTPAEAETQRRPSTRSLRRSLPAIAGSAAGDPAWSNAVFAQKRSGPREMMQQ